MPLLRAALWFVFYRQPSEFLMLNLPNLPALPRLLPSSLCSHQGEDLEVSER